LPHGWSRDIYLVDDHSETDAYAYAEQLARDLQSEGQAVSLRRHDVNRGKGAALQTGFDAVLQADSDPNDLVIIQDADLEYDPDDFQRLMRPILDGETLAVVGTRWGDHTPLPGLKRKVHALGNAALTAMSNLMTGYRVTDMECCYKLMTIDLLKRVRPMLSEQRFGIEPQMVASLARLGERLVEVPVHYRPRAFSAGKKIGWRDGVRALIVIARERLRGHPGAPARSQPEQGS
jgi:glycosyltransferase involved in cell wall biosynthesis